MGRLYLAICLFAVGFASLASAETAPVPKEFVIGRDTFFDFGPPFYFYELYIVRQTTNGR